MSVPRSTQDPSTQDPSAQDDSTHHGRLAQFRHDLLTPINHILGLTEIQIEEAPETGLLDCVPAFAKINTGGRTLQAIIEDELGADAGASDLCRLNARIESEAGPVLDLARNLTQQLHANGRQSIAEEIELVSSALDSLLSLSREMVRETSGPLSTEQVKK